MNLAIDTNAYADFCRGKDYAVKAMRRAEEVYLPFIVLAELRAGFRAGKNTAQNEKNLVLFLNSRRTRILFADEDTTHHYASLFYQLKKQGTPIPINDIWIAALIHQHHLTLLSRDAHFDYLPQIFRV